MLFFFPLALLSFTSSVGALALKWKTIFFGKYEEPITYSFPSYFNGALRWCREQHLSISKGATTTTTKWPFHLRRAINSGARDSKSKWIGLRGNIPSKRLEKNQKKVRGARENSRGQENVWNGRVNGWARRVTQTTATNNNNTFILFYFFVIFWQSTLSAAGEEEETITKNCFLRNIQQSRLAISVPFKAQRGQYGYGSVFLSLSLFLSYLGCYAWPNELRNGFVPILPFSSSSSFWWSRFSFFFSLYCSIL